MRSLRSLVLVACLAVLGLSGCHSAGQFSNETDQLLEHSRITFQSMMGDKQYPGLVDLSMRAKAIVIIPNQLRAAFLLGGRGGNAVMLVRDQQGNWSAPAFYTVGGLSFGLQIGGQASEIVITVMTERGLNAILSRQVTLGGDAGIAVGELGKGIQAATGIGLRSDLYAFARSEGLFVGAALDGAVISPRHAWNREVYGPNVTPRNILIDRAVTPQSASARALIQAMP